MSQSALAEKSASAISALTPAHGGTLKDLYLAPDPADALRRSSGDLPAWTLTDRQLCDLELLLNGAFSPLEGFLTQADYDGVVENMRLADGTLWPIPITLDVSEEFSKTLQIGKHIALRDSHGVPLAVLEVSEFWQPNRETEALKVFGTTDRLHPGVADLLGRSNPIYVGGRLRGLAAPRHLDFAHLRQTPAQLREWFTAQGWSKIVAFQTRNPMHRAHVELTKRAADQVGAQLLIHPVVGRTKPGDVDHFTRVRCYQALIGSYPEGAAHLSLLPLAMRMGGPREALWHAIIRKNYGANFFIVGRDHAGPGKDSNGKPFYDPFEAQALLAQHQQELGIRVVPFPAMVYAENRDAYVPSNEVKADDVVRDISGTELRSMLQNGEDIPAWFTFPSVTKILRERFPAKDKRGFCLFFTGLSGAGKSTLAEAVIAKLAESSSRPVTLLDGDLVRLNLSKGLGFSAEDRDTNVRRIGFVAAEIVRHGGIAVCAPIAPYTEARRAVRKLVEDGGEFIEIFVCTPLEVCEQRDTKGLYAQARAGKIKQFTGISDPYEEPENAELRFDTSASPDVIANQILALLHARGLVPIVP